MCWSSSIFRRSLRKLVIGALAACIGLAGRNCAAEAELPVGPDVQLRAVSSEVLAILKRDFDAGNPSKVAALVEAKVLPLFDFPQMTRIAVARSWRLASPGQQGALIAQFKTLLVRTYSAALATYRDERVEYRPMRPHGGATDVTVRSIVRRPGVEPLNIDYDMERTNAGWKVYDVKVAGVSLIIAYRASFAAEVRESGIDGLIKLLSDKNRRAITFSPTPVLLGPGQAATGGRTRA
jgi:phospholipid transport system substrate-binding protein